MIQMVRRKCSCSQLINKNDSIWRRQGIDSGNKLYPYLGAPVSTWKKYEKASKSMLLNCGYSRKNKIPDKIRRCLENENYHSLNTSIDFSGFGTKRYGHAKKDFFKRRH